MQAALVNQHRHLASLPCASVSVTLLLKFLQERLAVAWAFRWLRNKSMMSRRLSQSDTALHGVEPGTLAKCQNPAQLKLWAPFHEASEAREAHAAWNKFQASGWVCPRDRSASRKPSFIDDDRKALRAFLSGQPRCRLAESWRSAQGRRGRICPERGPHLHRGRLCRPVVWCQGSGNLRHAGSLVAGHAA